MTLVPAVSGRGATHLVFKGGEEKRKPTGLFVTYFMASVVDFLSTGMFRLPTRLDKVWQKLDEGRAWLHWIDPTSLNGAAHGARSLVLQVIDPKNLGFLAKRVRACCCLSGPRRPTPILVTW